MKATKDRSRESKDDEKLSQGVKKLLQCPIFTFQAPLQEAQIWLNQLPERPNAPKNRATPTKGDVIFSQNSATSFKGSVILAKGILILPQNAPKRTKETTHPKQFTFQQSVTQTES